MVEDVMEVCLAFFSHTLIKYVDYIVATLIVQPPSWNNFSQMTM